MMREQVKNEIIDLEKRFWETMKTKDVESALELTNDPCVVTGAQGVATIGREKFAEMMRGGKWTLESYRFENVQVELVSDDVAVIAYKVHEDLVVDDKPLALEVADSSVWVKRDGRWRCASHTESPVGDPFNRDRKPMQS